MVDESATVGNPLSRSMFVKLANVVLISTVQNVKLASSCSLRYGGIARQDRIHKSVAMRHFLRCHHERGDWLV
jgi:hypothetical protein